MLETCSCAPLSGMLLQEQQLTVALQLRDQHADMMDSEKVTRALRVVVAETLIHFLQNYQNEDDETKYLDVLVTLPALNAD